ncbi:MAG: HsdR family type I site-specific deoxyribonuclease [Bacteroidales bacterium]|nr:HsdR family type I site-specific deoxyribonuclease [Bacteroidales bacterium]
MANFISEDDIEKRAIKLLLEQLDYDEHLNCFTADEKDLNDGSNRSSKEEVVFTDRVRKALRKLNDAPEEAIEQAIRELVKGRSGMSPMLANKQVYELIKEGFTTKILNKDGREEPKKIKFIDFNNPKANEFLVVSQLWIQGMPKFRRPDLIIYINGIPLVFIELKNSNVEVKNAYEHNLQTYYKEVPQLFVYNAVNILSNAVETKLGAFKAEYEHYFDWLRVENEKQDIDRKRVKEFQVSLEFALRGLCSKELLIDYLENFILYHTKGAFKIIAKNHQFIGVNKAVESFNNREGKEGKLGVFWHTQGSGKSFSMVMFCQKIQRKAGGDFTFFVVTDRDNLDGQIYRNFLNMGAVKEKEEVRPKSGEQLREYLSGNKRFVFSLIHKFRYPKGKQFPVLSDRKDIIVLVDEAHRTQYKDLAENMRLGIPNAQYMAFTGTPLLGSKRLTNKYFGDYVSEYNFKNAYEDGSTVPLFYDKRVPEVQLIRDDEDLNADLAEVVEEEELSDAQQARLEREFGSELSVIRNPDRLKIIAKDIVKHFPNRGYKGRGMIIAIDKFTTVKMYDLVQQYWREEIVELRKKERTAKTEEEKQRIKDTVKYMNWVDMAVVISFDSSEEEKKAFEDRSLDITPHIRKMQKLDENGHDLEYRFQEIPDDPFQLVFVCAMWLTGFDSPTLSDLYLDKPMVGHTLMQTIARANRVAPGKICGSIVDYYGVFRNLKKALAAYATGDDEKEDDGEKTGGGNLPVEDKEKLFELLNQAINEVDEFCLPLEVKLELILDSGDTFDEIGLFEAFANKLLANEDVKKNFFVYSNTVDSLFEACKPEIYGRKSEFELLEVIRYLRKIVDRKKFSGDLESARAKYADIIDQSITTVEEEKEKNTGFEIKKSKVIDISKFDFDKLREKFKQAKYKHIEIEDLKLFIEDKLTKLLNQNVTRINFAEKLQRIINEYNSGSLTVENYFEDLINFSKDLRKEEERHIKENLTTDELELFDLIRQTNKKLTKKEEQIVKLAAKGLLQRLKEEKDKILVTDWYKDEVARLTVLKFVKQALNPDLPNSYIQPIFEETCSKVVEHLQRLEEMGKRWAA